MRAGLLRHFVLFEDFITDVDSDGAEVGAWVPAFNGQRQQVSIEPLSGRELIAAAAVQSKVSVKMRMQYKPGVRARMRVVLRSTIYDIEAVMEDRATGVRYLTLLCSTGPNDG